MINKIRDSFFDYGWLLPCFLPLAQVLGRAVFNVLFTLYFFWAAISVWGRQINVDRWAMVLYVSMIIAFSLSGLVAQNHLEAWQQWTLFFTHTLIFFFTLAALQVEEKRLEIFLQRIGLCGLWVVVVLYIGLAYIIMNSTFQPTAQMKEDTLAFLAPFLIYWIGGLKMSKWRYLAAGLLYIALLAYIIFSQGRAALVGLIAATVVYGFTVWRWRLRHALVIAVSIAVLAMAADLDTFTRAAEKQGDWQAKINRFSSERIKIWTHALHNPPDNLILGVGMGNEGKLMAASKIGAKHLHNFILDAWYETGLLGVTLLLAFLCYLLARAITAWKYLSCRLQQQMGVAMAGSFAILTAALFSYSYTSKPFTVYLFMCLAVMAHLSSGLRETPREKSPTNGKSINH